MIAFRASFFLRLDGWRRAGQPVLDELRTGDTARINELADELATRYPTGEHDRDRVVLSVALEVRDAAGQTWAGSYLLNLVGDAAGTAMARCVSVPLAYGISRVLDGTTPSGLHKATDDAGEAARWITFLKDYGIRCTYEESHG